MQARGRGEEYTWVFVNAYRKFDNGERMRQVLVMFTEHSSAFILTTWISNNLSSGVHNAN